MKVTHAKCVTHRPRALARLAHANDLGTPGLCGQSRLMTPLSGKMDKPIKVFRVSGGEIVTVRVGLETVKVGLETVKVGLETVPSATSHRSLRSIAGSVRLLRAGCEAGHGESRSV